MNKLLILIALLAAGCTSAPKLIMVKNCSPLGSGLFQCEEIPKGDIQGSGVKHL